MMKEQRSILPLLPRELRAAAAAALPMLRALTGACPALFPLDGRALPEALCAVKLDAERLDPDTAKAACAPLAPGAPFAALLHCGAAGGVLAAFAESYSGARAYGAAIFAASDGNSRPLADILEAPPAAARRAGRLSGKIAVVTGAAQGFGAGIAAALAREGASVMIADLNADGAKKTADALCAEYGSDAALSCPVNVADEASVEQMIETAVLTLGGLDIFINNAGIVRAGSLPEMQKSAFELVLSVNYTAYFLCVKHAVVPMKAARAVCPQRTADIIEINSKSGLVGSNKNFAYAGSKFGGIGLTQSFALELAEYGVKVNAVCPGNFLDGPLWSDPEKGLFVQYLHAGKVPGAKTVDDVRRFYEAKVPLGRGCRIEDLARAILYIIEQQYETGQAVPVTGGQQMLK